MTNDHLMTDDGEWTHEVTAGVDAAAPVGPVLCHIGVPPPHRKVPRPDRHLRAGAVPCVPAVWASFGVRTDADGERLWQRVDSFRENDGSATSSSAA